MAFEQPVNIDLHIHSTASDGSFSSSEILALAQHLQLGAISITDHDTVEGVRTAIQNGIPPAVRLLTGVEMSTKAPSSVPFSGSLHILGYGIQVDNPELNQILEKLREARANRNPSIMARLQNIGIKLTYADLTTAFKGVQLGRSHIAQLMKDKGYVDAIDEAFDRYLGKGKPAYVDKYRVDCAEAIQTIRQAGGVPVLAHPGLLNLSDVLLDKLVNTLMTSGLKGIEVYYPQHTQPQTDYYQTLATRFDLLMTGGTDFHGAVAPHIQLGVGTGDFRVPYCLYEAILNTL